MDTTASHSITITVAPTEEWLSALVLSITDTDGGHSSLNLHPHEASTLGGLLIQYGIILDKLNERLEAKPVEIRKEIMELEAKMLAASSADSPFDPVE
jgi:hypothetical protein